MEQFFSALNTDGEYFQHIVSFLPDLWFKMIKAGVFDGPLIHALVRDKDFVRKMNYKEKWTWFSFVAVMENFLGNKNANNCKSLVINLLSTFPDLRCNTNVKPHFLYSHLDRFPENFGAKRDK